MRRIGYILASVSAVLAALTVSASPALSQALGELRPVQVDRDLDDPLSDAAAPRGLDDDTFAQTLPLDDALEDPADRLLNRNTDGTAGNRTRTRVRTRRRASNAVPDLSETEIAPIPSGIPDRPFDLTTLDPQTTATVPGQPGGQLQPQAQAQTQAAARPDPYAPLGIRSGSFILFPELEVSGIHTDNVDFCS